MFKPYQKVAIEHYHTEVPEMPTVSVAVQTFQHSSYIKQCLDSILMQKTSFQYEILIGEDESNDGTREICIEYAKRHPRKIKLFLHSRKNTIYINGKPTGRYNFVYNLSHAKGKYIALCEGDDYWTDPNKLQKQVDILEKNEDCIACHHWHTHKYENGSNIKGTPKFGYIQKKKSSVKSIFEDKLRIKTRTVMYRNIFKEIILPDWFNNTAYGDVALSFIMGQYGDFYFIDESMAVYRITGNGVSTVKKKKESHYKWFKKHLYNYIDIWDYANELYKYKYNNETVKSINCFYEVIFKKRKSIGTLIQIIVHSLFKRKAHVSKSWPNTKYYLKTFILFLFKRIK